MRMTALARSCMHQLSYGYTRWRIREGLLEARFFCQDPLEGSINHSVHNFWTMSADPVWLHCPSDSTLFQSNNLRSLKVTRNTPHGKRCFFLYFCQLKSTICTIWYSQSCSSGDLGTQLAIKKRRNHSTAVSCTSRIISSAYPPHADWYANTERTIVSQPSGQLGQPDGSNMACWWFLTRKKQPYSNALFS